MDPSLRDAVLGSANIQTPTSPLGSFPELAALNKSTFQLPQSTQAAGAQGNIASDIVAQQKAAADAAAKETEQKIKDMADPSKYQQVARSDGGYGFYDPQGNEISAAEYAHITNKSLDSVLKNSQNPIDTGFVQDYKDLQDYANLKLQSKSNPDASSKAKAIEQQVKDQYGIDLSKMKLGEITDAFRKQYPTVFGLQNKGVPVGQLFIPSQNSGSDVQSLIQQLQSGG